MIPRPRTTIVAVAAAMAVFWQGISAGLFHGPAAASDTDGPRPWPLDIPIHLSSTFGEFRPGHFHAGVDIRTFGREGVPCKAVGKGWISRIRSSPFGYGKAAYLTLETGEICVYAHLSEFSPVLDSVVWDAQQRAGRYRVDIYPDAGTLPVRVGDVLGYTGRTGSAAPHLHFEVRDRDQNPINPLSNGWTLSDNEKPRILDVGWIPLTPASRVNRMCYPTFGELRRTAQGLYEAVDTTRITGRVGLSARIIDRLDASSGKLAPYRIELLVDGTPVTTIVLDKFTYSHTGEVELAYNMERARAAGRYYIYLFERDGETLWNRVYQNGGVIDADSLDAVARPPVSNPDSLEPGAEGQADPPKTPGKPVHMAEIRALDRGGNLTTALLPFVADAGESTETPPIPSPPARVSDEELPGCFFLGDLMSGRRDVIAWRTVAPGYRARPDSASIRSEPNELREDWITTVRETKGSWIFGVNREGGIQSVRLCPVRNGEPAAGSFSIDTGERVYFATRAESFYSDTFVYLTGWRGRLDDTSYEPSEIVPVTGAVRLGPLALVCNASIAIGFVLDRAGDRREAVYRLDGRDMSWSFVSSFVKTDTVSAYIGEPGVYAVFRDTLAPRIGAPSVVSRTSYATGAAMPELVIPIEDEGCGVNCEATEIYIDETRQIARWDGFVQKMFILQRNQNIIGTHDLRVVAVDQVGNTSQIVTTFNAPVGPDGRTGAPAEKKTGAPADADQRNRAPADTNKRSGGGADAPADAPKTSHDGGEAKHNAP